MNSETSKTSLTGHGHLTQMLRKGDDDLQKRMEVFAAARPIVVRKVHSIRRKFKLTRGQTSDVAHDAFLKTVLQSKEWKATDTKSFETFIGVVAQSIVISELRHLNAQKRGGNHQRVHLDPRKLPRDGLPESEKLARALLARHYFDRLKTEHPDWYEIVFLRIWSGAKWFEIEDVTGVNRSNAKRWHARALQEMERWARAEGLETVDISG